MYKDKKTLNTAIDIKLRQAWFEWLKKNSRCGPLKRLSHELNVSVSLSYQISLYKVFVNSVLTCYLVFLEISSTIFGTIHNAYSTIHFLTSEEIYSTYRQRPPPPPLAGTVADSACQFPVSLQRQALSVT
jgi:hypothetical protein